MHERERLGVWVRESEKDTNTDIVTQKKFGERDKERERESERD